MRVRDKQIFSRFASLVRKYFPSARIWAFGSRARGTATAESDLDVCVVVKTTDETIKHTIRNIAWQVGFDYDVIISTIIYSEEEFDRGPCSASSLVKAILTKGVAA